MMFGNIETGPGRSPLLIAEAGINHDGDMGRARQLIDAAAETGAAVLKWQCHIPDAEMIEPEAKKIIPANADESIWDIMSRCALTEEQERELKQRTENAGMIYLSTPFSVEAVERLERLEVVAYKIGSGELDNPYILDAVRKTGKSVILSSGMHIVDEVLDAAKHVKADTILECTSKYPTHVSEIKFDRMKHWGDYGYMYGLSDHTETYNAAIAATIQGASIIEKHFTVNKMWPGPDNKMSFTARELKDFAWTIYEAYCDLTRNKKILGDEKLTQRFAGTSIVTRRRIKKGQHLGYYNFCVKRPPITGVYGGQDLPLVLDEKIATCDIEANMPLWKEMVN